MAYTVGIKKWWGYEKISVTRHSWENFRFIFDLANGEQLHVPGFRASGVKVYADFWKHVELQNQRQALEQLEAALALKARVEREELEEFKRTKMLEAGLQGSGMEKMKAPTQKGATAALQRVRGILPGADEQGGPLSS